MSLVSHSGPVFHRSGDLPGGVRLRHAEHGLSSRHLPGARDGQSPRIHLLGPFSSRMALDHRRPIAASACRNRAVPERARCQDLFLRGRFRRAGAHGPGRAVSVAEVRAAVVGGFRLGRAAAPAEDRSEVDRTGSAPCHVLAISRAAQGALRRATAHLALTRRLRHCRSSCRPEIAVGNADYRCALSFAFCFSIASRACRHCSSLHLRSS